MSVDIYKLIIEFIKNFWATKYIYYYTLVIPIITILIRLENYSVKSIKTWIEIMLIVFVYGAFIVAPIALKRKIPRFSKNKNTILFSIDAESEKDIKVIKEKFIKDFEYSLLQQHDGYQVATLNKFQANKLNLKILHEKEAILDKYNIDFIIYGRCKKGESDENIGYLLNIDDIEFKKRVIEQGRAIIKKEIKYTFVPLCDITIYKTSINQDFEQHAMKVKFLMDYIIGTVFLMSRDYKIASEKYCNLREKLLENKKNDTMINVLKSVIENRVYLASIFAASEQLEQYLIEKQPACIAEAKSYLDRISPKAQNYVYHQVYAIHDFLYNRNIKSALSHIEECSVDKNLSDWRFSRVFLKLYEKNNVTNLCAAYKTYKKLFEQNDFPVPYANWLLDFICLILEMEPEKNQLNFLIVLLHHFYFGDKQLKAQYFGEFMRYNSEKSENDNFKSILLKLGLIQEEQALMEAI